MKLHRLGSLAAACVALLAPALCLAQASVVDEFTGSPGPITGTGGGTGFGANNYSGAGNIVSPGLTFPGLLTAGNAFSTAGSNNGAFRTLGAPINTDAGTVYIAFLTAATNGTAPDYAGLSLFSNGQNTEEIFLGKPFQVNNYGFDVSNVNAQNSPTAPVRTAPSLLVYRLTFTPAGDKIDFFANPTPGTALPATPTLTFNIPEGELADTLTSIRMQSGEGAGTATPFLFDELRGGGSFADVAPVPEPAALGLLGAAGLLALRRRR